ncbi:MAG TPA: helix-turn-helix domain-containing protein [Nitrospira sp.]|nr:helix-turn-helix domain-containing protein [Nitrospira sp.]
MLTVKELSVWLNIKQSTLYLWVSKNKIPCRRIHGLVRFEPEAIQAWLNGFSSTSSNLPPRVPRHKAGDVDHLIEAAKRAVYTPRHGETRPTASPLGKESNDGAR